MLSPHGDSPSNRVVAVDDRVNTPQELIHTSDLVQVLLCHLQHLEYVQPQEVDAESAKIFMNCFYTHACEKVQHFRHTYSEVKISHPRMFQGGNEFVGAYKKYTGLQNS